MSTLPPTRSRPSSWLIIVWQNVGSASNGPTLNSLLGIVRLNGEPFVSVKVMSIFAGSVSILSHEMPYVPGSAS